ncbi:MAG: NUDIX hydrolase [Rhizomicrobium sp.]|jgi:nudix-type nucleoside diphosphatase (YffH/AdpP family)
MTEIISARSVYSGWSSLSIATVRGRDGRSFERIVEHHGFSACVLPYDPERKTAILVSQFRAPVRVASGQASLLEAIAGLTDGEDPSVAATREALEEAGLRLSELEPAGIAWVMPGLSTERMNLFLARYSPADRVAAGGGEAHEHEDIAVVELSLGDVAAMADAGTLNDLKTLALVQTLRVRRPALFR